jgi:protein-S-isoprenylcysteine O-methyltransferase Ste14
MLHILLWMLVFAVVHSITADKRFKQLVINRIGARRYEGLYRLFYNILSFLMLAPVFLYMLSIGTPLYSIPQPIATIFRIMQLVGVVGLGVSLVQIDLWRFVGLRQFMALVKGEPLPLADEALQTGGLYGWMRHPLYFFSLLALWFTPNMTNTGLIFNVAATLYFIFGSLIEEQRMVGYYGEMYQKYQQNVAWMIPHPPKNVK